MPIAARLVAAFALLLVLLGLMLAQALGHAAEMNDAVHRITQSTLNQVMLANRTQNAAQVGVEQLYSLFLLENRAQRMPVYGQIDQAAREQQEAFDALLAEARLGRNDPLIARVLQARARYVEAFDETVSLVELDPALARPVMVSQTMPALRQMLQALDTLVAQSSIRAGDDMAGLYALHSSVRTRLWRVGLLAVLVALLSAALITHSIARPLRSAVLLAGQISAGQLDTPLPPLAPDEVGVLTLAMDEMRRSLARREARIAELAYRDDLTGLANRTLFIDRLEQALASAARQGQALSVLVLDLDRFKQVNDVLGHALGDQVLREVGERLRSTLSRTTDTVARLGGDEFAVLLPTQDHTAAVALGQRLLSALESPVPVQGQRVDVSASIGIACSGEPGLTAAQLMARADLAMREAKQGNHGQLVFDASMERHVEHGLTLLSDLRQAGEQDEFFLLFQPKLHLADGQCDAAEVLVRWRHPLRGVVPPDRFIPFAEQTGAIKAITRWVLQNALAQLASWQQQGWRLSLNVNVSTRDLSQPDFPGLVARALREAGVASSQLCLEVTESAIMDDPAQALRCLQALDDMGVRLSIDDFGTGQSSLAYLKKLPVHELKIDRSFVTDLDRDETNVTIVRSTIDMAHHMGLKVVAEGIETEAVSQRLRSFGCDQAQGFLYSRPLPALEFIAWLRQRRSTLIEPAPQQRADLALPFALPA